MAAGELAQGNSITSRAGPKLNVVSVSWQRQTPSELSAGSQGYTVYNFEVANTHTYFVGTEDGGTWVHNPQKVPCSNVTWPEPMTESEALDEGINWVGDKYHTPKGFSGNGSEGVYRSDRTDVRDGNILQFRMTNYDLLGIKSDIGPHVHFQTYNKFGDEIENIHVPIIPD